MIDVTSQQPSNLGREVAVIDIGSNSIRLVLFRVEGRVLWPTYNEKTMAALGRGASQTGKLNSDGVEAAIRTLKRFALLLQARLIRTCHTVATAAVRECRDGPKFVERIYQETGLDVEVLSGEEEGRRSALGVIAGLGQAEGVAGDLGGSSVELVRLEGQVVGRSLSLPLGPLSVSHQHDSVKGQRKIIDEQLVLADPVLKSGLTHFYAVGGAWRAIANFDIALNNHPLNLLHQYELSADQLARTCEFIMGQSSSSLAATPGVSAKRAEGLPYSAHLLLRIFEHAQFKTIVFSALGLREGVIFARDNKLLTQGDPLIAGADALARNAGQDLNFGGSVYQWLKPILRSDAPVFTSKRDAVLYRAGASLIDMGARMHPDHRAELCLAETLYAPFGGISHKERAFLALAIHHRYAGKKSVEDNHPVRRLLGEDQIKAAQCFGMSLRFAAALSGQSARLLESFALERTKDSLRLKTKSVIGEGLVVERAETRFNQLASVMGLEPQLVS